MPSRSLPSHMTPECPPEGFEALQADQELADPPQRVDLITGGESGDGENPELEAGQAGERDD